MLDVSTVDIVAEEDSNGDDQECQERESDSSQSRFFALPLRGRDSVGLDAFAAFDSVQILQELFGALIALLRLFGQELGHSVLERPERR